MCHFVMVEVALRENAVVLVMPSVPYDRRILIQLRDSTVFIHRGINPIGCSRRIICTAGMTDVVTEMVASLDIDLGIIPYRNSRIRAFGIIVYSTTDSSPSCIVIAFSCSVRINSCVVYGNGSATGCTCSTYSWSIRSNIIITSIGIYSYIADGYVATIGTSSSITVHCRISTDAIASISACHSQLVVPTSSRNSHGVILRDKDACAIVAGDIAPSYYLNGRRTAGDVDGIATTDVYPGVLQRHRGRAVDLDGMSCGAGQAVIAVIADGVVTGQSRKFYQGGVHIYLLFAPRVRDAGGDVHALHSEAGEVAAEDGVTSGGERNLRDGHGAAASQRKVLLAFSGQDVEGEDFAVGSRGDGLGMHVGGSTAGQRTACYVVAAISGRNGEADGSIRKGGGGLQRHFGNDQLQLRADGGGGTVPRGGTRIGDARSGAGGNGGEVVYGVTAVVRPEVEVAAFADGEGRAGGEGLVVRGTHLDGRPVIYLHVAASECVVLRLADSAGAHLLGGGYGDGDGLLFARFRTDRGIVAVARSQEEDKKPQ